MKKLILTTVLIAGTAMFAQAGDFTLGLPGFFLSIGNSCCGGGTHQGHAPRCHENRLPEGHHGPPCPGKPAPHHDRCHRK